MLGRDHVSFGVKLRILEKLKTSLSKFKLSVTIFVLYEERSKSSNENKYGRIIGFITIYKTIDGHET